MSETFKLFIENLNESDMFIFDDVKADAIGEIVGVSKKLYEPMFENSVICLRDIAEHYFGYMIQTNRFLKMYKLLLEHKSH